jgi:antirestriction protein
MYQNNEIKDYVDCLAAYNAGHLHGEWIEVTDTEEYLCEIADFIREAGEELAGELLILFHGNVEEAREAFSDRYHGEFNDLGDYAKRFTEDCGDVPARYRNYIDFDAIGNGMKLAGEIAVIEAGGKIHVFSNS